jgi:cysteine sulfinate desulfinase/cysteine desulfurase-like protein
VSHFYRSKKNHIVTLQTVPAPRARLRLATAPLSRAQEHKCVLDSCRQLQQSGIDVTYLPVQKNGLVDLKVRGHAALSLLITLRRRWRRRSGRKPRSSLSCL